MINWKKNNEVGLHVTWSFSCQNCAKNWPKNIFCVQRHPRSLHSVPIKSACVTSYSWLIVTLALSRTVSEIQRLTVLAKNCKFFLHPFIYRLRCGWLFWNLWKIFTDPETRVLQAADGENMVILACAVFDWSTRVADRRTDGENCDG